MKLGAGQPVRGDDDDFLDEDFYEFDDDGDVDATKYIGQDTTGDSERKPRLIDEQFDHVRYDW
jgi:hypothetical protein